MSSRNAWRCPATTTGTSLAKMQKRLPVPAHRSQIGLGLDKAPSPACAVAQDTGADTLTLRTLERVQTGSGAHLLVQTEATARSDTRRFCLADPS